MVSLTSAKCACHSASTSTYLEIDFHPSKNFHQLRSFSTSLSLIINSRLSHSCHQSTLISHRCTLGEIPLSLVYVDTDSSKWPSRNISVSQNTFGSATINFLIWETQLGIVCPPTCISDTVISSSKSITMSCFFLFLYRMFQSVPSLEYLDDYPQLPSDTPLLPHTDSNSSTFSTNSTRSSKCIISW